MRSHTLRRRTVGASLLLVLCATASPAFAQNASLRISVDGKTLSVGHVPKGKDPTIVIEGGSTAMELCPAARRAFEVRYRGFPHYEAPRELTDGFLTSSPQAHNAASSSHGDQVFSIKREDSHRFLIVNILQGQPLEKALGECVVKLAALPAVVDLEKAITAQSSAEVEVKRLETDLAAVNGDITSLERTASDEAARLLGALHRERRKISEDLDRSQSVRDSLVVGVTKASAVRPADHTLTAAEIKAELSRLKKYPVGVIKIAGIPASDDIRPVYFGFTSRSATALPSLSPMTPWPVARHSDALFLVIANVPDSYRFPFALTSKALKGPAVNTAPVRPTFGAATPADAAMAGETPAVELPKPTAFVDVFLPVLGDFSPNDVPEVSITTLAVDPTDPKKLSEETLLDKAKLPQFRAAYRYNFSTGVFRGAPRPTIAKVRKSGDDPTTEVVEPNQYAVVQTSNHHRAVPVASLTYYWRPVDIRGPLRVSRWPNPTIALSLKNPLEDFFVGVTLEVVRNAHVFIGTNIRPIDEPMRRYESGNAEALDATVPPTRQRWEWRHKESVVIGFSLNLDIFKNILQK